MRYACGSCAFETSNGSGVEYSRCMRLESILSRCAGPIIISGSLLNAGIACAYNEVSMHMRVMECRFSFLIGPSYKQVMMLAGRGLMQANLVASC